MKALMKIDYEINRQKTFGNREIHGTLSRRKASPEARGAEARAWPAETRSGRETFLVIPVSCQLMIRECCRIIVIKQIRVAKP